MRCKACNRILEDFELTRKDQHGDFLISALFVLLLLMLRE